ALFNLIYPSGAKSIQSLTWPVLNNYSDTIVIYNHLDTVACEIVYYDSDWFESWNTQSIARIFVDKEGTERSTWVLARKPSPGLPNPEISWQSVASPTLDINPIPFTPNGDGEEDILDIILTLPGTSRASIDIYGFNGKILYKNTNQIEHKMEWDGKTSNGKYAPAGPFFVVGTIKNGSKEIKIRKKGILWR
ncbi:MAG: gliding motility-associated C-terminal domain-containing protein, partial [Chitinispirillia bacterium]